MEEHWKQIVKSKDKVIDSLTEKVKEREDKILNVRHLNGEQEKKLQLSVNEALEKDEFKDNISDIKAGVERLLAHMGDSREEKKAPKRKKAKKIKISEVVTIEKIVKKMKQ